MNTRILAVSLVVFSFLILGTSHALPRAEAAASGLAFDASCAGGKADVTFYWNGADPSSQQWIDLSLFDNGWQAGTFIGAGPIAGSAMSYTWRGLVAGNQHVVRINQLSGGQWYGSQTWAFTPCASTPAPAPPQIQPQTPPSNCHPSYQGGTDTRTGGCIQKGIGDYDCAGGSGNGPNYVRGPVKVVGPDEFQLDADHDGVACER